MSFQSGFPTCGKIKTTQTQQACVRPFHVIFVWSATVIKCSALLKTPSVHKYKPCWRQTKCNHCLPPIDFCKPHIFVADRIMYSVFIYLQEMIIFVSHVRSANIVSVLLFITREVFRFVFVAWDSIEQEFENSTNETIICARLHVIYNPWSNSSCWHRYLKSLHYRCFHPTAIWNNVWIANPTSYNKPSYTACVYSC